MRLYYWEKDKNRPALVNSYVGDDGKMYAEILNGGFRVHFQKDYTEIVFQTDANNTITGYFVCNVPKEIEEHSYNNIIIELRDVQKKEVGDYLKELNLFHFNRAIDLCKKMRLKQHRKWGEDNHDMFIWITILMEEVGKLSQETLQQEPFVWPECQNIKFECISVAAVAIAMLENILREEYKGNVYLVKTNPEGNVMNNDSASFASEDKQKVYSTTGSYSITGSYPSQQQLATEEAGWIEKDTVK